MPPYLKVLKHVLITLLPRFKSHSIPRNRSNNTVVFVFIGLVRIGKGPLIIKLLSKDDTRAGVLLGFLEPRLDLPIVVNRGRFRGGHLGGGVLEERTLDWSYSDSIYNALKVIVFAGCQKREPERAESYNCFRDVK